MRTTSVRFVERESRETPAVALVTSDVCFWRREETVASRMTIQGEVARQNRFAMIEGMPVELEEWANTKMRTQRGVAGRVFDWREASRLVGVEASPCETPNQSPEPTPLAVTIPAYAGLAPSSVVAHL